MATVRAAAVYARISSDPEGTALGVARQLADCQKLAAAKGWGVAEEYVDNDLSAYAGKPRPAYERMVADVRDGLRDAVVVYNLDRLTRQPKQLEEFVEVCAAAGVRDLATVTADIDLGNDDGLFMARIFSAFAAKESGRRSARVLRKMEEVAAAGRPHGGSNRPFGFAADKVTHEPAEAEVIRVLVARFLAGESLMSLARWLDAEQIQTVRGKPWRTPTLRALIRSGRIAGLREHRGAQTPAVWDPIITAEQHRRVLARFSAMAVSGRRAPQRYLLSGMLRCGRCGGRLFSAARVNTRRYVCSSSPDHGGCGRLTIVSDPVERIVVDQVLLRLDTPQLADALAGRAAADSRAAAFGEALSDDRTQLAELAQMWGAKQISRAEFLAARAPIEARISDTERRMSRLTGSDALAGLVGNGEALTASWSSLNLSRQAAIVGAIIDHVVIEPGQPGARAVDPERIRPVWRV